VPIACIILLVTAGITDLTRRIIPNGLIVAGTLTGLGYGLLETTSMGHGFITAVSGLLTGGLLLFLPYRFSWTGAGDVKLLATLGTWLGPLAIVNVFVYTTLVGGLVAAGVWVRHRLKFRRNCVAGDLEQPKPPLPQLPYAIVMGAGYLLCLVRGNI
jgi:prepilin peptidase CpaA